MWDLKYFGLVNKINDATCKIFFIALDHTYAS